MTIPRYWREFPSRYNLLATRCGYCGRVHFPPRMICPQCHRASLGRIERVKLKGTGVVVSYTIVHEPMDGFEFQVPYVMAIIEMDEGVRLTGQLIDIEPERVEIGMRVKAAFRKLGEDGKAGIIHYGYKFVPEKM